jgi:ParB-like chromosome segregation protein Spo0J
MESGIHPDLASLATPIDSLSSMPGNPRKGDVAAVARSYAQFGQRKPIVVRREGDGGIVLAGNHQLAAARQLGWDKIAVVWVEDDDLTARAFSLADNRTGDLGSYDDDLLAEMLAVVAVDPELLAAAGYSEKDLRSTQDLGGEDQSDQLVSVFAVVVSCRDELHQLDVIQRLSEEGLECRALVS